VWTVPRLCKSYPGICLTTEDGKHGKTSIRVRKTPEYSIHITKTHTHTHTHTRARTLTHTHTHACVHAHAHTLQNPHFTTQYKTTTVQIKTNTVQDIPK
jgi:hypothetical protein